MKTFVTFGQDHTHTINGITLDKDCVAVVEEDRDRVFELFGPKFCFEYPEQHFDWSSLKHFPRGPIYLDCEPSPADLINEEAALIVQKLREAGFGPFKCEDEVITDDDRKLIELMTCSDEQRLCLRKHGKNHIIFLVWGNEPGVAMADYSDDPRLDWVSSEVNRIMESRRG